MSSPPALRRLNAQAVLDALLAAEPLDAAALMAATGLSRPTVHAVCDDLIERGLAVEGPGPEASGPGRRARWYALRGAAAHVVGVDMGETTVRAAVADLHGNLSGEAEHTFEDARLPAGDRLAAVCATVATALDRAGIEPAAVRRAALGVPAPVTADGHAVAVDTYLPGLAAVDLRAALAPLLGAPVRVENDANLAVLAERWRGAAQGCADAVLVLAGERLGAGLCLDGRLVRGHAGGAGEMGFVHLLSEVGGPEGIGRLTRLAAGRPAPVVFAAARDGDPAALAVLDAVTGRVARALAVLATVLDPQVVVVGGAVAVAGDVLLAPLRSAYAAALPERPLRATPELLVSPLADRGPLLGAVRVALDALLPRLLDAALP